MLGREKWQKSWNYGSWGLGKTSVVWMKNVGKTVIKL